MRLLSNPYDRIWLALMAATAITVLLGETGQVQGRAWPVLVMFGLSFVEGAWIALDFMELRHAPRVWRWFVLGWLAVVLGLIVGAWWVAAGTT